MSWYKVSVVGLSPFDQGEITLKTTTNPFGEMGGDSKTGIFSPSDGFRNHSPNDPFAESNHEDLTEELIEKRRKNKKKVRDIIRKHRRK
jgi:hypothetical protein